ncbi:MAG: hypothetical protein GX575_31785 [Candidatus Anammoximicrobium sp.]|nr:hypothetical protein [Candidatus Anammoximicrobium sp.]
MIEREDQNDRGLRKLISEATIPRGFRPETADEIETMLDVLGGEEYTDDVVERILAKAAGRLPLGRRDDGVEYLGSPDCEESESLLAMHRSAADDMPGDVQHKLDELRRRAKEHAEQDDDKAPDELET